MIKHCKISEKLKNFRCYPYSFLLKPWIAPKLRNEGCRPRKVSAFSNKNLNPAERMKIREINWNPHRWKGFSPRLTPCVCRNIYIYMDCVRIQHIYIYAVELKTGPIFAFSSVKNWSIFFVFFCFWKSHSPCRRGQKKKKKKKKKKQHF